jgi:hypothetical protein
MDPELKTRTTQLKIAHKPGHGVGANPTSRQSPS